MTVRARIFPLSLALVLSFCFASLASAQYLERSEDGYFPQPTGSDAGYLPSNSDRSLSRAGAESGFQTYGPPMTRFGIALDFGAGGLRNKNLDRDFFEPNNTAALGGVTSLAFDVTLYLQLVDSFRVGFNVGQLKGGKTGRDTDLLHAGLVLEGGQRFYTGWGIWAGANLGYGRGRSVSRTYDLNEYSYEATGLGVRGFVRFERELAPFITLRLTPFVDTLVRTSEYYQEDVLASTPAMVYPDDTKGTYLGYGVMLGVSIHSF